MPLDYNGQEIIHHGTHKSIPLSSMAIPHLINTIRLLPEDSPDAPIYAQELVHRYNSEELKTARRENTKAKIKAAKEKLREELKAKYPPVQPAPIVHVKHRLTIDFCVSEDKTKALSAEAASIIIKVLTDLNKTLQAEGIDFTRFSGTLEQRQFNKEGN